MHLRGGEAGTRWVFLAFFPCSMMISRGCLAMKSGSPKDYSMEIKSSAEVRKMWGACRVLTTVLRIIIMTSQGLCSRYITCKFQPWSALLSSEWAITKVSWPVNFLDTITFLCWGSRKLKASRGLRGTTHTPGAPLSRFHLQKEEARQWPFSMPEPNSGSLAAKPSFTLRWPPKVLGHSWLNELDN